MIFLRKKIIFYTIQGGDKLGHWKPEARDWNLDVTSFIDCAVELLDEVYKVDRRRPIIHLATDSIQYQSVIQRKLHGRGDVIWLSNQIVHTTAESKISPDNLNSAILDAALDWWLLSEVDHILITGDSTYFLTLTLKHFLLVILSLFFHERHICCIYETTGTPEQHYIEGTPEMNPPEQKSLIVGSNVAGGRVIQFGIKIQ